MCDITIDNFDVKFQEIAYNLQKANFIAIDTEFSGLHLENAQPSIRDEADTRYKKLRKSIQLFNVLQVGLSAFRYCNEQRVFISDSYNFYLFPRNYGIGAELHSTLQTSCIEFLCKHDFDFNKLCYKGIPYMNIKQEKQLEAKLSHQIFFAGVDRDIDEKYLQNVCSQVADWVVRAETGDHLDLGSIKDIPDFVIHKELRDRFDYIWTHQDGVRIIVEKVTKEKRFEYENCDPSDKKKTMDTLLGFTKIFRLLVEHKKPLVLHNGFMDLMFFYEKFHDTLPESVYSFKKKINELFPLIYDTKHIAIECRKHNKYMKELYESTVLESLHLTLEREVSKKCSLYMPSIKHSPTSSDKYSGKSFAHEAGYDAFLTGSVFLRLAHALATYDAKKLYNLKPNNMNDYFQKMKPYANKIQIVKAALYFINLTGPDPESFRIKQIFVQSKHLDLSIFDLIGAFSSFGHSEVTILTKKTALVAVDSQFKEDFIMESFAHSKKYRVFRYSFWKHNPNVKKIIGFSALATGAALLAVCSIFARK